MTPPDRIYAYVFRDCAFAPAGDAQVCVVERGVMATYLTPEEVAYAFTGSATYGGLFSQKFVGVWGRRNGKRFRRFLSERGAKVQIISSKPARARLLWFSDGGPRRRVRRLSDLRPRHDGYDMGLGLP